MSNSLRKLCYHGTGSNLFGQWYGCNKKIMQKFSRLHPCERIPEYNFKHAKLVHIGWSHNIYLCADGFIYLTGDYNLLGNWIERLELPLGCVYNSDIAVVSDDFYVIIVDKIKQMIWSISLGSKDTKFFHINEVPIKNKAKKAKSVASIIECCAANNIKLFLSSEGLVYSGLPPSLVDTEHCVGTPIHIRCGYEHCLLLTDAGKVYSWGQGRRLQLGHGDASCSDVPTQVITLDDIEIRKISAGGWHSLALSSTGDLFVWGWNETGQLGIKAKSNGDNTSCALPTWVDIYDQEGTRLQKPIKDVACGSKHSAILLSDDTVWTSGYNKYGQLGFPRDTNSKVDHFKYCCHIDNAVGVMCGQWATIVTCEE